MKKTTLRDIIAYLNILEEAYHIEPCGETDPILRLGNIVNQLVVRHNQTTAKLKHTTRDLAKVRRKLDESEITWRNFGKYIGANSYDLEKIFGIERKTRQNKADRKAQSKQQSLRGDK